jgi:hypothetical protein
MGWRQATLASKPAVAYSFSEDAVARPKTHASKAQGISSSGPLGSSLCTHQACQVEDAHTHTHTHTSWPRTWGRTSARRCSSSSSSTWLNLLATRMRREALCASGAMVWMTCTQARQYRQTAVPWAVVQKGQGGCDSGKVTPGEQVG